MALDSKLIVYSHPKSPYAEAYRVLRTNLQFSGFDKPIKTILVTSSMPSEGKSTTVCNLAMAISQTGKKVLLMDCDLRKPSLHKKLNIHNGRGLTNVIAENEPLQNVLQNVSLNNLDILTCGPIPPNPSELLGSNKMKDFISSVSEKYDYVLMDTPPVISVTDAAVLSAFVDGVILVVSHGQTEIEAAKRAKELLVKVNANILGVVLNKIPEKSSSYYYSYYYYYDEDQHAKKRKRKTHKKRSTAI